MRHTSLVRSPALSIRFLTPKPVEIGPKIEEIPIIKDGYLFVTI